MDPDATFAQICAVDTPTRLRVTLALDLLVHLAKHGDMGFLPDEREHWSAVCEAVLTAELDSYQSLLLRMENR
jgi:hypothetical protein